MKGIVAFLLAVGLVGGGLWLSDGLGSFQAWLFGAGLIGLVGLSVESFLGQPSSLEAGDQYQAFNLWVAPGLLLVAGLWLIQVIPAESRPLVAVAGGATMAALLLGLRAGLTTGGRYYRIGRFVGSLILYLLCFLLFALIYHTKERSLLTATATGLVALLAALEALRSGPGVRGAGWRLAAIGALVVAETTWALNYWPVSGLIGGAVLLLTFYVFAGLLLALQEGALERRVLAEYGTVGVAGFLVILWAVI
ncbi:MAG: hypothetical protein ACM3US_03875 [Sphingomonadaceae bacterium]